MFGIERVPMLLIFERGGHEILRYNVSEMDQYQGKVPREQTWFV